MFQLERSRLLAPAVFDDVAVLVSFRWRRLTGFEIDEPDARSVIG